MSEQERFELICRESWEAEPFARMWELVDENIKTKYRAMVRRVLRVAKNVEEEA